MHVALLLGALLVAPVPHVATAPVVAQVVHVIDGDTIQVKLGARVERLRYIGINAAEIPHPRPGVPAERRRGYFAHTTAAGEAARRINLDLVAGKQVRLEFDRRRRDEHGRLLAYVWVGDVMVNAELVRRGYAEVMSVPPDFRYRGLFVRLQDEARAGGRGLWQAAPPVSLPRAPSHRAPAPPSR
jgi:micrococcal nuclease